MATFITEHCIVTDGHEVSNRAFVVAISRYDEKFTTKPRLTREIVLDRRGVFRITVDTDFPSSVTNVILHSIVVIAGDRLFEEVVRTLI